MRVLALLSLVSFFCSVSAATLAEIERAPDLTPERFSSFFRDFDFRFHNEIQAPEIFLASHSGDCDDYATLAAQVLRQHGYSPRLIAVRMPRVVHVVCYIPETHSYLDYNLRAGKGVVESRSEISEIARSVAGSYGVNWSSASEFTFDNGTKRLVKTVLKNGATQLASSGR